VLGWNSNLLSAAYVPVGVPLATSLNVGKKILEDDVSAVIVDGPPPPEAP